MNREFISELKKKFDIANCCHVLHPEAQPFSLKHFPHCQFDEYEQTRKCAVLVLLFKSKELTNDKLSVLFTVRTLNLKQFPGEICFPGGKFDPEIDKSYEDTALRETNEEIGLKPENIEIIAKVCPIVSPIGHFIVPIIGVIVSENDEDTSEIIKRLKPNPDEVELVFWVPLEYFSQSFEDNELFNQIVTPLNYENFKIDIDGKPTDVIRSIFMLNDEFFKTSNKDLAFHNTKLVYGFNAQVIILCTLLCVEPSHFKCILHGYVDKNNVVEHMKRFSLGSYFLYKTDYARKIKKVNSKI